MITSNLFLHSAFIVDLLVEVNKKKKDKHGASVIIIIKVPQTGAKKRRGWVGVRGGGLPSDYWRNLETVAKGHLVIIIIVPQCRGGGGCYRGVGICRPSLAQPLSALSF